MFILSRFGAIRRGESSVTGERPPPQPLRHLAALSRPEVECSPTPDLNDKSLVQRYGQLVQDLRSSLPSTCRGPEDINLIGKHPIAAGGFADIYEATLDGRKVVLKSYRCYESFDVARVVTRFHSEAHVWSLLHRGGGKAVSLVGVYSTEAHPFGLVYQYMEGLDLRQYLKNAPNVGRLQLLMGISRGLKHMHDLSIVHGNLRTANILVGEDNTVQIAGLGNASILPHSMTCAVEGGISADRLSRSRAPESTWPGVPPGLAESTYPTKAGDMYAFGVVTWEVLTGQPPFSEMTEIAATYSMLNGARPPRPNHHGISDRVWHMIERCWHNVPSKRMTVGEVVNLLETELGHTPSSSVTSCTE